jgi:hypothetical protein
MNPTVPKDIGNTSVLKGELWHLARWRHVMSLGGKRLAELGIVVRGPCAVFGFGA